ncbi:MAG: DUF1016 family protein [Polyangiaceae bacterium]|nr:DUF1016 family protein [Polyangiaceae bacterium]
MASKKLALASAPAAAPKRSRGRVRAVGTEFPLPPKRAALPADYAETLVGLKRRILESQRRAAVTVNRELIALYFHIGAILDAREAWGEAVIERLAYDLKQALPKLEGFSARNLWRMRAFYRAWARPEVLPQAVAEPRRKPRGPAAEKKLPQAVAELPWGQNLLLLEKLKVHEERLWYAHAAHTGGWSRAALADQIAKKAHLRKGKTPSNFAHALPADAASLAQETLKDPYIFDFLTCGEDAHERVLERELLAHVRAFLLELGAGFALLGSQVKLNVGGADYFLDLLFYHVKLHCYVVVELKAGAFQPEHAGKLNFYLSAVDDLLKSPEDKPSIGLLLCKSKDHFVVEYALRDVNKPIGVAHWETQIVASLPKELQGALPTVEEIEAELGGGR